MKLILLGSGTSTGVPRIGNDWGECDPKEPRNRRTRASIVVESDEGKRLLVDTSTDLRQQMLANGIDRLDGLRGEGCRRPAAREGDDAQPGAVGSDSSVPRRRFVPEGPDRAAREQGQLFSVHVIGTEAWRPW